MSETQRKNHTRHLQSTNKRQWKSHISNSISNYSRHPMSTIISYSKYFQTIFKIVIFCCPINYNKYSKQFCVYNVYRQYYTTCNTWEHSNLWWAYTDLYIWKSHYLWYLANWLLYTLENGFQGAIKCQGSPFLGFAQVFSAHIVQINCQNGLPLKHSNM